MQDGGKFTPILGFDGQGNTTISGTGISEQNMSKPSLRS